MLYIHCHSKQQQLEATEDGAGQHERVEATLATSFVSVLMEVVLPSAEATWPELQCCCSHMMATCLLEAISEGRLEENRESLHAIRF